MSVGFTLASPYFAASSRSNSKDREAQTEKLQQELDRMKKEAQEASETRDLQRQKAENLVRESASKTRSQSPIKNLIDKFRG